MELKEKFDKLNTPEELFEFMKSNLKWGWISKSGELKKKVEDFVKQYQLSTLEQVLKTGCGTCFEQVELEREFFVRKNIPIQTYIIEANRMAHAFLVFEKNGLFYKFEHSSPNNRGIFPFDDIVSLLRNEIKHLMIRHKIKNINKLSLISYNQLPAFSDTQSIKLLINNSDDIIPTIFTTEELDNLNSNEKSIHTL